MHHINQLLILTIICLQCSDAVGWTAGKPWKGIWSVTKAEWWGTGMVVCLQQGADLHMAQLTPLPLTVSCFNKIQIGLPFWYRLTWVVPEKGQLNVCVILTMTSLHYTTKSSHE